MPAPAPRERSITVDTDDAELAGSLWLPGAAVAGADVQSLVLMLPGSGPSTRHNDVLFPPIRNHFLGRGHAVASFDKRGVGGSYGRLADTTIARQAADAEACLDALRSELVDLPIAVFGHSQGGWVAYELGAARTDLSCVVANSAPAVGPAAQERFRLFGAAPSGAAMVAVEAFDAVVALGRDDAPFDEVRPILARPDVREYVEGYADAEDLWPLFASGFRYEPAPALAATGVPTLVLHGADDSVIPVAASLDALAGIANPVIEVLVLPQGDHRVQTGGEFVPGYFDAIDRFLASVAHAS